MHPKPRGRGAVPAEGVCKDWDGMYRHVFICMCSFSFSFFLSLSTITLPGLEGGAGGWTTARTARSLTHHKMTKGHPNGDPAGLI